MKEFILSILISWLFVNILKPVIIWIKDKKISWDKLIANGGMPSGHTSLVVSSATALFLETGFSPLFILGVILSLVVMYDAFMVRNVIEEQSRIINTLTKDIKGFKRLEENVGHSLTEVLVSLVFGIIIPIIVYAII